MKIENLETLPINVTITNTGITRSVNISGVNQHLNLKHGDTVILRANTVSELIGYLSQANEELIVEAETDIEDEPVEGEPDEG